VNVCELSSCAAKFSKGPNGASPQLLVADVISLKAFLESTDPWVLGVKNLVNFRGVIEGGRLSFWLFVLREDGPSSGSIDSRGFVDPTSLLEVDSGMVGNKVL
jgi:hypothetical protein